MPGRGNRVSKGRLRGNFKRLVMVLEKEEVKNKAKNEGRGVGGTVYLRLWWSWYGTRLSCFPGFSGCTLAHVPSEVLSEVRNFPTPPYPPFLHTGEA
jgi:hypothetical protein